MRRFRDFKIDKPIIILRYVIGMLAAALIMAFTIDVLPGGDGEFGDWLGYWGDILGSLFGAFLGAIVSYYVTTGTQASIDKQRINEEVKFKIQTENIPFMYESFSNMLPAAKHIDEFCNNLVKLNCHFVNRDNRQVISSSSAVTDASQLIAEIVVLINQNRKYISELQELLDSLMNVPYYGILKQMKTDNLEIGAEVSSIGVNLVA